MYVVEPLVHLRGISLHPLAVIVAVLAGAELAGVAGMFLAVAVTAVASVAFRHWLDDGRRQRPSVKRRRRDCAVPNSAIAAMSIEWSHDELFEAHPRSSGLRRLCQAAGATRSPGPASTHPCVSM